MLSSLSGWSSSGRPAPCPPWNPSCVCDSCAFGISVQSLRWSSWSAHPRSLTPHRVFPWYPAAGRSISYSRPGCQCDRL